MNMIIIIVTGFVFSLLFFALLAFVLTNFLKKQMREEAQAAQEQFMLLSKQQFEAEQNKAVGELEVRKQAVELTVKNLKEELGKYQQMMREFESDRAVKYGNLENELKRASETTLGLQETTNRLTNILGNVKLRGQWGERMAEDIIRFSGLIEGVNYVKQTKQETTATKPDYTFLLPNEHKINMDVKFPLDNYLKMVNTNSELERDSYRKDFERNVKDRVKEIQSRDYINPAEQTLDFVLLFIPNEQVFGLIQEQMPGLMDEALRQKVVLCSPFTLYAMLSVVRQAHENFRYEKDMKKIILLFDQFVKLYEKFKERFDEIGKNIEKMEIVYNDVKTKNFKSLDTKIRHIEDYKKGKGLTAQSDQELLLDVPAETVNDESIVS